MAKVIPFSQNFPVYHPRAGEPTNFVEKFWTSLHLAGTLDFQLDMPELEEQIKSFIIKNFVPKNHTIREGHRFKAGDWFSPRIWGNDINIKSGRSGPYQSKQIIIAPDIEIKKVWDFEIVTEDDDGESDWSYIRFLNKSFTVYSDEYLDPIIKELITNDGFSNSSDFWEWFRLDRTKKQRLENEPKVFSGQIICWNKETNY